VPEGSTGDRLLAALGYRVRWTSWVLKLPPGATIVERPLPEIIENNLRALVEVYEGARRQGVRRALDALPERERRILELRFGFEGEPWTLEAIGHELDLTRERVRQLEGQALARLGALRDLIHVAA